MVVKSTSVETSLQILVLKCYFASIWVVLTVPQGLSWLAQLSCRFRVAEPGAQEARLLDCWSGSLGMH